MSTELDHLEIRGAREHNLKNIDLRIPKKKLVVFTGVSGSGKSSLAFDTLFAEGQRRYVESLSAYARQFLGQMDKPVYESIRGLSPTIAIDQKTVSRNPRSTVGTITEILDYLRVLYARVGIQHCTQCDQPVTRQSLEEIVDDIESLPLGTRFQLLAPVARQRKGSYKEVFTEARAAGFARVVIDGKVVDLEEIPDLDKKKRHDIDIVVDRLVAKADQRNRLSESVEIALRAGQGVCVVDVPSDRTYIYSEHLACHDCQVGFSELTPARFSFNSPLGMCSECNGLGYQHTMSPLRVIPDTSLCLDEGAVVPWASAMQRQAGWQYRIIRDACNAFQIDRTVPWKKLSQKKRDLLLHGSTESFKVRWKGRKSSGTWTTTFEGVLPALMRKYRETQSTRARQYYEQFMEILPCTDCQGARIHKQARHVRVGGHRLHDLLALPIGQAHQGIQSLDLSVREKSIAAELLKEIHNRLGFLVAVGLNYLSLDRSGPTLSGGESQRIRLASQVGSELTGVLYILDEPSIGLHQRDNARLLDSLVHLRDIGNSVLVVEHDRDTIARADHIVDFGPGAGRDGGHVVYAGPPGELESAQGSLTSDYMCGRRSIEHPRTRRQSKIVLRMLGARGNNLKDIDVDIPLGTLVSITGVSGAGKSTLINGTLAPALSNMLHGTTNTAAPFRRISGQQHIDKIIEIDQRPIGRTPRSNPATYTKVFDEIRIVFAHVKESRIRGYAPGRFSFNVKGGRCEACQGDGVKRIEMHFLADVFIPCAVCEGKRFNEGTLQVRYNGLNIAQVLDLTVSEALEHFSAQPKIVRILRTIEDVGLGYIHLGQPATTLSGGEAQRVKLSRELAKRSTGSTLYLLDEPTTGLHFHDVSHLLKVLHRLVDAGNSVIVIEHNIDVIESSDWIIDIGPEGGDRGGMVVAMGTPEDVSKVRSSYTGKFLKLLRREQKEFAKRNVKTGEPSQKAL